MLNITCWSLFVVDQNLLKTPYCIFIHIKDQFTIFVYEYLFFVSSHGSLHLRQNHTTVWQEGIFVSFDAGQIKVEPMQFPDNRPGVRVTVRCQQQIFKPMGFVVDHIETLLSEWYPGKKVDFFFFFF